MWSPPPTSQQNGLIVHYVVNVSSKERKEIFRFNSVLPNFVVHSLHPFTSYSCAVAAETIAVGPFSAPVQIATPEDGKSLRD